MRVGGVRAHIHISTIVFVIVKAIAFYSLLTWPLEPNASKQSNKNRNNCDKQLTCRGDRSS